MYHNEVYYTYTAFRSNIIVYIYLFVVTTPNKKNKIDAWRIYILALSKKKKKNSSRLHLIFSCYLSWLLHDVFVMVSEHWIPQIWVIFSMLVKPALLSNYIHATHLKFLQLLKICSRLVIPPSVMQTSHQFLKSLWGPPQMIRFHQTKGISAWRLYSDFSVTFSWTKVCKKSIFWSGKSGIFFTTSFHQLHQSESEISHQAAQSLF